MNLLILMGILATVAIVGLIGATIDARSRASRREVASLRAMRDRIAVLAADHASAGDPFAAVVLDEIRQQTYKEFNR